MPKNVTCNVSRFITQSEYCVLNTWDYFNIKLHFTSVGMRHLILLTKQAYSGVFFRSNLLNVLGPSLPESALFYIICCSGTKGMFMPKIFAITLIFFSPTVPDASLGVAANQTTIPIMHAAERGARYVQRGVCFVELDRTEVRSLSHLKRTYVPGFVWRRTETSCSGRSRSADLVHIEAVFISLTKMAIWWLRLPKKT
ncbi:unnamed protein product [Arctogadus glacialis]